MIVFMPVFLQSVTGVSATESGFLLLPLLLAGTLSTIAVGPRDLQDRPLQALPADRAGDHGDRPARALALDARQLAVDDRRAAGVFGLGFGLVSQVLTVAIQNAVDRRDLGIATALGEPLPLARRRDRRRGLRRDLRGDSSAAERLPVRRAGGDRRPARRPAARRGPAARPATGAAR